MTNEVIWTKLVLERFIQLANLTEEEEIVIRTRAAMCGVVRYPNATTYCSGSNPFGGCGCGAAI